MYIYIPLYTFIVGCVPFGRVGIQTSCIYFYIAVKPAWYLYIYIYKYIYIDIYTDTHRYLLLTHLYIYISYPHGTLILSLSHPHGQGRKGRMSLMDWEQVPCHGGSRKGRWTYLEMVDPDRSMQFYAYLSQSQWIVINGNLIGKMSSRQNL